MILGYVETVLAFEKEQSNLLHIVEMQPKLFLILF